MFRVANLCAELTSRCNTLNKLWLNATKALHFRNTEPNKEPAMFYEIINKINVFFFYFFKNFNSIILRFKIEELKKILNFFYQY